MKGCRPLEDNQINKILKLVDNLRDRLLIMTGINTGFRISELLSLKICDVINPDNSPVDNIIVAAKNTKTKVGRSQAISKQTGIELARYARKLLEKGFNRNAPLFISRNKGHGIKEISRQMADIILKRAFNLIGLFRGYASHTLRKTFARIMYRVLKKIELVQIALGHKTITSTMSYLSFENKDIFAAARGVF